MILLQRISHCDVRKVVCPRYLNKLQLTARYSNMPIIQRNVSTSSVDQEQFKAHLPRFPPRFNFALNAFDRWANDKAVRSNSALWWVHENGEEFKMSYEDMSLLSHRVAGGLHKLCNIKAADRILVLLPKAPEFWLLALALTRLGAICMPATIQLSAQDLAHRLRSSRPQGIVAMQEDVDKVERAIKLSGVSVHNKVAVGDHTPAGNWCNYDDLLHHGTSFPSHNSTCDDPMFIFFTSGTTGQPKMVELTHGSANGHEVTAKNWLKAKPGEVIWSVNDPGWAKILYSGFCGPWSVGATVFAYEFTKPSPANIMRVLKEYPVTTFCAAPTLYRLIIQHDMPTAAELPKLKHALSAGEPCNPEVITQWKKATGLQIRECYGQTETVALAGMMPGMEYRPGSMGKPLPGIDLQIIDESGKKLPPGEEGAVGISVEPSRPRWLFTRYVDDPAASEACISNGFFLTGDRGYMDQDGYIFFVGRSDDVIISSGYRIGPSEVESALLEHPAVVESAAVAYPDPIRGVIVKAFVVLSPAFVTADPIALTSQLQDFVKTVTAPYKYPRVIEFVAELPKTASGKIRRVELRKRDAENLSRVT